MPANDPAPQTFLDGELYKLLLAKFPQYVVQQLSIHKLAEDMDMSSEGVYKWVRVDRLTVAGARKLIAASKGGLTFEDLAPFVLR